MLLTIVFNETGLSLSVGEDETIQAKQDAAKSIFLHTYNVENVTSHQLKRVK